MCVVFVAAERVRWAEDVSEELSPQLYWIVRDGERAKNHPSEG